MKYKCILFVFIIFILGNASTPPHFSFPDGKSSFQNKTQFPAVKLIPIKPSFFSNDLNHKIYIGLIDSKYDDGKLLAYDCDYSLLEFLKLRYKKEEYDYTYFPLVENVNVENGVINFTSIEFKTGIPVIIFNRQGKFLSKLTIYDVTESNDCGNMPTYASGWFKKPQPMDNSKNQMNNSEYESIFILPLNDSTLENLKNISASFSKYIVKTQNNISISGEGIDFNHDGIMDLFWYWESKSHQLDGNYETEDFLRLYMNINGEWVQIWYVHVYDCI